MIKQTPALRSSLQLAALFGLVLRATSPSLGQQPAGGGGHPFDGQWSLIWDLSTAPGGATFAVQGGTVSSYNGAYHAAKAQFKVGEDGRIEWAQSDAGSTSHNGDVTGGRFWGERTVHLRAAGTVQAPRAATGELRAEDRRLSLDLTIMGGSGYSSATGAVTTTVIANIDDLEAVMFPWGIRAPNPPWTIKFEDLKPIRVSRQEFAPEVIQETITFEVKRETRIPKEINGLFTPPMTERLEIKHVRFLSLVPRG
jgi:hypothetical protein